MHRWLVVGSLLVALSVSARAAQAQVSPGVAVGPSSPVGDLADLVSTGFHAGVAVDIGIPFVPIGGRGDLMFQHLPGTGDAGDFQQVFATANARLRLVPAIFSFHIIGGVGLYGSSFDPTAEDGDFSLNPGLNAGIGLRVGLFGIRPFVEARYHHVLTDPGRAFVPVSIGFFF